MHRTGISFGCCEEEWPSVSYRSVSHKDSTPIPVSPSDPRSGQVGWVWVSASTCSSASRYPILRIGATPGCPRGFASWRRLRSRRQYRSFPTTSRRRGTASSLTAAIRQDRTMRRGTLSSAWQRAGNQKTPMIRERCDSPRSKWRFANEFWTRAGTQATHADPGFSNWKFLKRPVGSNSNT